MNVRRELIAAAVRAAGPYLPCHRPVTSGLESFMTIMFDLETPEERQARELDELLTKATNTVQKIRTNRKFKKIIQNI